MSNIFCKILYHAWLICIITLSSTILVFCYYGFCAALICFICNFLGILYKSQDLLLYYPNDPSDSRTFVLKPSCYGLPYENIMLDNQDGDKINIYLIKQLINSDTVPTMIFFHGNAGNMGQRMSFVSGVYQNLNINIVMVEYRGYGVSEGKPSEQGFYEDAQCVLDFILSRDDIDKTQIIVFGRSLGGAVAIDLVSNSKYNNKVWALIVENTFTSIPDMSRIILKWSCLKWLPLFCHKNKYMSLGKIGTVKTPTLVLCGSEDILVPPLMAQQLYVHCGAMCKMLAVVRGGGHDDTWTYKDYYPSIRQFLLNVPKLYNEVVSFSDEINIESLLNYKIHIV